MAQRVNTSSQDRELKYKMLIEKCNRLKIEADKLSREGQILYRDILQCIDKHETAHVLHTILNQKINN